MIVVRSHLETNFLQAVGETKMPEKKTKGVSHSLLFFFINIVTFIYIYVCCFSRDSGNRNGKLRKKKM